MRLAVPKAFVVLAPGQTPSKELAFDILKYAREHLAPYKRIRLLEFTDLPKTISGKIRRVELREDEAAASRPARTGPAPTASPTSPTSSPDRRRPAPHSPVVPSTSSRTTSRWPAWRAYSCSTWNKIHSSVGRRVLVEAVARDAALQQVGAGHDLPRPGRDAVQRRHHGVERVVVT